jgi:tryptophan halogenase
LTEGAIRSVAVVGGGIVALSAAAAFARVLPQIEVILVETPLDPAALADRLPGTQPSIAGFHRLIGLEEADLIATGAATWRIGTCFREWSASGNDWYQFDGECGPRIGTIAFHHLWARAARSNDALPYHAYSVAGLLAQSDKFVLPVDDPSSPFASYDYALRIEPDRYRDALTRHCDGLRVTRVRGWVAAVELDDGGAISAVVLDGGRKLSTDLYVDCGGPSAPLLSQVGADFEDWTRHLPRCSVTIEPSSNAPAAVDQVIRKADGWSWDAPGVARGRVFAADAAAPEAVTVTPGRQRTPWLRNVVAIGDAAVALDPLGWTGLQLAHSAVELALALLPDRNFHPVELAEYNRRAAQASSAARDLATLLYHCSGAPKSAFWRETAKRDMPDALVARLEQFGRRGYLSGHDEDTAGNGSLIPTLLGLGYLPRHTDPFSAAVAPVTVTARMAEWTENLSGIVAQIPSYGAYLSNTLLNLAR